MFIPNTVKLLSLLLPLAAIASGCAASTEDTGSSEDAIAVAPGPGTIGTRLPIQLPNPPTAPWAFQVTPYPTSVEVQWIAPDDATSNQFVVYRRDASWAWQQVYSVAVTTPDKKLTWVDTNRSLSAECYMVTSISNVTGLGSSTKEACTVRPDPSVFPQSAPAVATEWYGLPNQNDGVWPLDVGNQFLQLQDQTWGVDLGFGHETGNNVKAERQGLGNTWPLMKGEAIAIRVWGAGWLKYGHQTWGVDLVLSDTPAYEWYVVNEGTPGQNLDSGEFALWNKSANDFLIKSDQTWGVNLDWYKKTLPPTGGTGGGSTPSGVREIAIYNCIPEARPLEMWVDDQTAGASWVDKGTLDEQYMDGSCPSNGSPWTFVPVTGHTYTIRAMDYSMQGCDGTPYIGSCIRLQTSFLGDATNGQVEVLTAGN
jgi:hypothetical protein